MPHTAKEVADTVRNIWSFKAKLSERMPVTEQDIIMNLSQRMPLAEAATLLAMAVEEGLLVKIIGYLPPRKD